ncbi:MAG: T9SS type A sorting domain-containing protein, partial [Paludibacteraceae bacterium]|nr:T9SS type A sorting domain-containing protein [Paludibacteraceae bacterium]
SNGCDSTTILHLTVNYPVATEFDVTTCGVYTWNGNDYNASGDYTQNYITVNGCDSVVTLHLTILTDAVTETEELIICESEFPYVWRGETLTATGTYTVVEQYEGTGCDSVIHVLNLQIYVMTLPTNVTMPVAICGSSVDVVEATADIENHIATTNLYAPNAVVEWYISNNGNWTLLTNDSIKGGLNDITLKYVITSDCGSIESEVFTVTIEVIENGVDVDDVLAISKYENRIFLLHLNDFVDNYGWTPSPDEVTWYKVVNDKDQGILEDDVQVGTGHSYNELDGSVIKPGEYYALIVSNEMADPDDCDGQIIMRTITLSSSEEALSPRLLSNVVRPNDNLRLINLNSEEITEIFVYNMMGELIDTYMVDQASEFTFNANHVSGYYLIDVKTANNKTTLRYIVK